MGIFLGYMAMEKNIIYLDTKTKWLKTGTHIFFDEANMTLPPSQVPAASTILQHLGYKSKDDLDADKTPSTSTLNTEAQLYVQLLHPNANLPCRTTKDAVSYDVYSVDTCTIELAICQIISTGIVILPPLGTYAQLKSHSSLVTKHSLNCLAGVIDPDYHGKVKLSCTTSVIHHFPFNLVTTLHNFYL